MPVVHRQKFHVGNTMSSLTDGPDHIICSMQVLCSTGHFKAMQLTHQLEEFLIGQYENHNCLALLMQATMGWLNRLPIYHSGTLLMRLYHSCHVEANDVG